MRLVILVLASLALALAGCKRNKVASAPPPMGTASTDVSTEQIAKLADSCAPESRAELVKVAGSTTSRALRCEAMKSLAALAPGPAVRLLSYTRKNIEALTSTASRDALVRMLSEREAWCRIDRGYIFGDQPTMVSPTQIALWVLTEFPVPSLRKNVEAVPANIEERAGALREYERIDKHHESPAVAYVDGLTADGSSDGFQQLVQFLVDGEPWPPSIQAPMGEDAKDVHAHVLVALEWLQLLAGQHEGDVRYALDCVQGLKTALRTGRLGDLMLSHFDQFDPEVRVSIMNVFMVAARQGSRPELERIASRDPDENVRDAAKHALMFVDRGGYSALNVSSAGSAGP